MRAMLFYLQKLLKCAENLTLYTDYPSRGSPGPKAPNCDLSRSTAAQIRLLEQTFILVRDKVRLDLGGKVHDHDHHDQQGCAAEVERHVPGVAQQVRHQADRDQVQRTGSG